MGDHVIPFKDLDLAAASRSREITFQGISLASQATEFFVSIRRHSFLIRTRVIGLAVPDSVRSTHLLHFRLEGRDARLSDVPDEAARVVLEVPGYTEVFCPPADDGQSEKAGEDTGNNAVRDRRKKSKQPRVPGSYVTSAVVAFHFQEHAKTAHGSR